MVCFVFFRALREKKENDASPKLTVQAVVRELRADVSHASHPVAGDITGAHGYHTTMDTTYTAVFGVESGDQLTFTVGGDDYRDLREGDAGWLMFQGTRYLGFDRVSEWQNTL